MFINGNKKLKLILERYRWEKCNVIVINVLSNRLLIIIYSVFIIIKVWRKFINNEMCKLDWRELFMEFKDYICEIELI